MLAVAALSRPNEKVANQRNAQRKRSQHQVAHQSGALLESIVLHIGLRLFSGNHRRNVLQEINPALFAAATLSLLVFARRTFVA